MTDSTSAQGRILTLDVVRGIAVMGILVMNIAAFAMPYPAYANPAAWGGDSGANLAVWLFNFILFDGKMRGLFSILFGASTLMVIERAAAAGADGDRAHFARMITLLAFGLVHFYFIWWGDILVLYAMCGMLLYFFRARSAASCLRWAVALISLSILYFAASGLAASFAGIPNLPAGAAAGFAEAQEIIATEVGAESPKIAKDLALYKSDYLTIVESRLIGRTFEPFVGILGFGLETLGLMLIGMALFKSGMLTGQWPVARYRAWTIRAALVVLPPLAFLAWWQITAGFDAPRVFLAFFAWSAPFDILAAVGWATAIIWWVKVGPMPALKARVAATGRMAFTNYLMTSVVMTTIFYGYGGNLFGVVPRAGLWAFVIGMWALMLLWSKPWLDRFHYGPLEWLWRTLARMEPQPRRRA